MHEHTVCEHEILYCSTCDVNWCKKCNKHWYAYTYTWANGSTIAYPWGKPVVTHGSTNEVYNIGDVKMAGHTHE